MHCKYIAEIRSENDCRGNDFVLTLKVEQEGKYWTAQKRIYPEDLQLKGIFDLIFDDLKVALKQAIEKKPEA